ncbi:MAG TPA: molybdopterin cofactor-binding domain-containing protein, partial [Rhizomicrobium sp.]|nr:molybdopterin cofactor-binding domain-containing protein [Rhizomicrobium sp.]
MATEHKLIGKDFPVPDIEAKVTGRAKYAEDFRADNMVFCKTLTSPIPHAKIAKIDTTEAMKIKGVLGILTADDVPQFPPPAQGIFAKDETFYVGEPILAVAAESEEIAVEAIEAIKIDFQELPHVVDPLQSLFPGGPNARSEGNVAAGGGIKLQTVKWEGADFAAAGEAKMPLGRPADEWHYGDIDAGFKKAKVVVEENFVFGTMSHNCMETRSAFAYWQGGKCFLHGSNQSHTAAIANIARYIGIPPENLVFIAEYCGGGFGS